MNKRTDFLRTGASFFCVCLVLTMFCTLKLSAQDLTVNVDPNNAKQQVKFGGDCKLTVKKWSEKNTSGVAQKLFSDMKLEILRVPIYAMRTSTDPFYDKLVDVMNETKSKNPNVVFFASVANGDGDLNNNLHGADKFPSSMKGCCPYNLYSLNLTAYSSLIDDYIDMLSNNGLSINYLGPWNEDGADESDYSKIWNQMNNLGSKQRIGVETWGLQTAVNKVNEVKHLLDIIGAHTYDDPSNPESSWSSLVSNAGKDVWYTEATKYKTNDGIDNLIAGMENIYPAIRGGVKAVIFYQTVPRFVWYNGGTQTVKYTGFKNLVNNAWGKKVMYSSSTNSNVDVVAFGQGTTLSIHLINKNSTSKTAKIQLNSGYKAQGTVTRTIWTSTDTEKNNSYTLGGNSSWNVTLPANSYVHVNVPLNMNTKSTTAILSADKNSRLPMTVFPNPVTSGILNIRLSHESMSANMIIKIVGSDGKLVMKDQMPYQSDFNLDVNDYTPGLYHLSLVVDGKNYNEKFIVKH